jgi:hypothetical protein
MGTMRRYAMILICLAAAGCRHGKAPATTAAPRPNPSVYVDLQPGWRLRVITPLLAGGGYQVKGRQSQEGNTITLETRNDFLGFETAYYTIGAGLKVEFANAEVTRDGQTAPQAKPVHPLFAMRRGMKLMRLVFLERGSSATHDMAVLTARNLATLEDLTAKVRAQPAQGCNANCEWVPAGIAVRAEKRKDGIWVPAH